MNKSGERLKNERERLGISAAKIAEIGGVGRTAQFNYEKNISKPDTEYLAKVSEVGIDILYVITGVRTGDPKLKPDEAELVENYHHSEPEEQKALQTTSAAFALQAKAGKVGKVA